MSKRKSNKKVRQMMISTEDSIQGILGRKTYATRGWHGFTECGLFHCSGSNFLWPYDGVTVSLTANQLKGK